jgi:hypothetical protein
VQVGQHFAELVFGKTIFRKYKTTLQHQTEQCRKYGPQSHECVSAELALVALPVTIVYDTLVDNVKGSIAEFKDNCQCHKQTRQDRTWNCVKSIVNLFLPFLFVVDPELAGVGVLMYSIASAALPYIEKYTVETWHAIRNVGARAWHAVTLFGNDAGRAVFNAGEKAIDAMHKITGLQITGVFSNTEGYSLAEKTKLLLIEVAVIPFITRREFRVFGFGKFY